MATKRVDEPTPNGGAYSIGFYQDSNGNDATEEDATVFVVNEYDKDDNVIASTIMRRGGEAPSSPSADPQ